MVARPAPQNVFSSPSAMMLLAATLLLVGAAWAVVSWHDARRDLEVQIAAKTDVFRARASLVLESAEGRLRRGEGLTTRDLAIIAQKPLSEARANIGDGQVGLSRPYKADDGWRAVMALAPVNSDQPPAAIVIDLAQFDQFWPSATDISLSVLAADGTLWWTPLVASGAGAVASGAHALDVASADGGAIRPLARYGLHLAVAFGDGAIARNWASRLPWSSALAAVIVLGATILLLQTIAASRGIVEAQRRMRLSEARLADWTQYSADVFWETGPDHRFTEVRCTSDRFLPAEMQNIRGQTRWELAGVTDVESDPFWRAHRDHLDAHLPLQNFDYMSSAEVLATSFRISGGPVYDDAGVFKGYRGVAHDIRDMEAAAEALRHSQEAVAASERALSAVIEQLPAMVCLEDTAGRIILHNKAFAEAFQIDQDAAIGKIMSDVVGGRFDAESPINEAELRKTGTLQKYDSVLAGTTFRIVKYPLFDAQDADMGIVTVCYDVTEIRAAEARVAESERRLAHMVEMLPAGAVYVEDNLLTVNASVETLTGRARTDFKTLDDWFELAADGDGRASYEAARDAGFPEPFTLAVRQANGARRDVEWAAYRAGPREVWLLRDVTEANQADARFRRRFDTSFTGFSIVIDGRIVDCNKSAVRLIGAGDRDSAIGLRLLEIMPEFQPDGRSSYEHLATATDLIAKEGLVRGEYVMRRLDGVEIELDVVGTSIEFDGKLATLAEWQEVSARKSYEAELLRSREQIDRERRLAIKRMNDCTDAINGWIWETDADGRFVFVTESVERVLGLSPEWHYHKDRYDVSVESDKFRKADAPERMSAAIDRGVAFHDLEFLRGTSDGGAHWVRSSGMPFFDEAGTLLGYRGASISIEYEKQLEAAREALRDEAVRASRRLEDAIAVQSNGFALFDADDRLVACNTAYREIGQYLETEVGEGVQFLEMVKCSADRAGLVGDAKDAYIEQRMFDHLNDVGTVMRKRVNGRWFTTQERRTEEGGVVGSWMDVTELMEAREASEAANVAKSEFLAMISHEIRTPMNAVLGMASALLHSNMKDQQRDQVETIQRSGEALLSLINDVLDLSKIEAGRIEMEAAPFDLIEVLDTVMDIGAEQAQSKQLPVFAIAAPAIPSRLVGDANRLRQVLLNLLSNAVKFTESGLVRLAASVVDDAVIEGQVRLRFEVSDTGIGIPSVALDTLFQPFIQADASTTRRFGGTGLGLTISKQLVELLGGEIGVESTPGVGSRFWIEAPFTLVHQHDQALPALTGEQALVAAPEGVDRDALTETLAALGAVVDVMTLDALHEAVLNGAALPAVDRVYIPTSIGAASALEAAIALGADDVQAVGDICLVGDVDTSTAAAVTEIPGVMLQPARSWRLAKPHGGREAHVVGAAAIAVDAAPEDASAQRLKILVVEDNEVNRKVAKAILSLDGHELAFACNGLEAVAAVRDNPYDIVLMDMQMPLMDGLDATRIIRGFNTAAAKTPIVAMTANAMAEDRIRCLEAGMDDFMSKPIDHTRLNEVIRRWVPAGAGPARATPGESHAEPVGRPEIDGAAQTRALIDIADGLDVFLADGSEPPMAQTGDRAKS